MATSKKYIATKILPPWTRHSWQDPTQKQKVYEAVKQSADEGVNRADVSRLTNLAVDRVSAYLAELKRLGLVSIKGAPVQQKDLNAKDSALYAMVALETALVSKARESGITDPMRKEFARYQKVKALALGGMTDGETRAAVRLALLELVKLVF